MNWADRLVAWFNICQRTMPWRSDPQPYRVWVSEVMLSQTQVDTVIPYFERFITQFPSVQSLANANLQAVLKAWEGLGYYSRARNLHKAAKWIVHEHDSKLPDTYEGLQTMPGVGPYVAAAIASIAFGKPVPVVDGNVLRVFARFWGIADDIRLPATRVHLFEKLTPVVAIQNPSSFNQAMMELGALVCRPKNPECAQCPLQIDCYAHSENKVTELPYKSKAKPVPHYTIGVGLVIKNGQILIGRRKAEQMLGGLWEFPGGKQKPGESITQTILREVHEETGLEVTIVQSLCMVDHAYTHFKIRLHAYLCDYVSGTASANTTDEVRWVGLDQLDQFPFPTANRKVIDNLLAYRALPLLAAAR
ncbi:MAG: A/G-specific adenine glycosylase [Candidatus Margulisiibacteriota bacterium]